MKKTTGNETEKQMPVEQRCLVLPLPCPFCGGDAAIADAGYNHWAVRCKDSKNCSGQGLRSYDRRAAFDAWNRRQNADELVDPDRECDHKYAAAGLNTGRCIKCDAVRHFQTNDERIRGGREARIQFDGLSPSDGAACVCPAWARCKRGSSPLWKYQK